LDSLTAAFKKIAYAGVMIPVVLLLLIDIGISADSDWTYLFIRDGIEVYRKTFPGTPVCAFKGVGVVDAEMSVVRSVLQDIPAYPQWMARCKESKILKAVDADTRIFYGVVDTPLPFKDRDMILRNTIVEDPDKGVAEIIFNLSDQGIVPPRKKYFRVTNLSGKYILETVDCTKTRVTFVYQGDPGGNIPVTIANWLESQYYPHTIIMGLRKMVKQEKYLSSAHTDKNLNRN
jgi:hypothetical protein